ncbi:chromosome segregation in meiosis- protein [Trapelia coarctata]|nr:chromosome segregation in meiosis- protein [Trapelia coarctata]
MLPGQQITLYTRKKMLMEVLQDRTKSFKTARQKRSALSKKKFITPLTASCLSRLLVTYYIICIMVGSCLYMNGSLRRRMYEARLAAPVIPRYKTRLVAYPGALSLYDIEEDARASNPNYLVWAPLTLHQTDSPSTQPSTQQSLPKSSSTMPSATTTPAAQPTDDLDDLFNYDVDDDVFADLQPNMDAPPAALKRASALPKVADLGIDEEIQVVKKRKPIAKLDENRLLSQAGIPKLRRITKERLKFKGKGHEYTDVARLLTLYQLWLDDLYPRAKFADGLAIIEKLGHSKRMQLMRRDWIREGNPVEKDRNEERRRSIPDTGHASSDPMDVTFGQERRTGSEGGVQTADRDAAVVATNGKVNAPRKAAGEESLFFSDDDAPAPPRASKDKAPKQPEHDDFDDLDDLDALLAESYGRTTTPTAKPTGPAASHDDPPEDDLDALLAEDAARSTSASANPAKPAAAPTRDDFHDEMEAMADMEMDMGGGTW